MKIIYTQHGITVLRFVIDSKVQTDKVNFCLSEDRQILPCSRMVTAQRNLDSTFCTSVELYALHFPFFILVTPLI